MMKLYWLGGTEVWTCPLHDLKLAVTKSERFLKARTCDLKQNPYSHSMRCKVFQTLGALFGL
eukprot:2279308-Amphidinium_carterae.1